MTKEWSCTADIVSTDVDEFNFSLPLSLRLSLLGLLLMKIGINPVLLLISTTTFNSTLDFTQKPVLCSLLTPMIAWVCFYVQSCSLNKQDRSRDRAVSLLSQRDRAAGCVIVFAKSRKLELCMETIFYGHRSIFNHCDIIGLKISRIRWKKRKIRAITAF